MHFDDQTRTAILQGYIETKIYQGCDADDVGKDCALLMEAMLGSEASSTCGDKAEKQAHCGEYNAGRR